VLTQQPEADLRHGDGVGRVHPEVWRQRRVRGTAVEVHVHLADRESGETVSLQWRRVHHHRQVHAVERAAFEHEDLAATNSSAGVPNTRMVMPRSSATRHSAIPAPTPAAAMMLCPQA
jgi:hypothetical protein